MSTRFLGNDVWRLLDQIGQSSPKVIAVAYVSGFPSFRISKGDQIITNASPSAVRSGQTSASLLLRAAKAGAHVYSHRDLHAKVILTKKKAVVGSANLSQSSRGLKEAALVTTVPNALSAARQYLRALRRQSKRLQIADIEHLATLPVVRGPRGWGGAPDAKPSLLGALREYPTLLNDLAFAWYCRGRGLTRSTVREQARRRRVPLPAGSRWDWCESDFRRGVVSQARGYFSSRPLVFWEVELDPSQMTVTRFRPHDKQAVPYIEAFRLNGRLVEILGTTPFKTSIDLSRERRALATILSAGLKKDTNLARTIGNNPIGMITPRQLRRLFELGNRAIRRSDR